MKPFFFIAIIASVVSLSCGEVFGHRIRGNGNIKTEARTSGEFTGVDVSGAIDLYIKQDSVRTIRIEADENLLQHIEIISEGDKLIISPESGYNLKPTSDIKVYVSSPVFKRLEASGACDIFSENKIITGNELLIDISGSCDVKIDLNAPKVVTNLSGSCNLELKGETKDFIVDGSGSTDIKCMDLLAENVSIDISGSGSAEVFASVKLDVDIRGAGSVRYKGNAKVNQNVSGSGSVKKVE